MLLQWVLKAALVLWMSERETTGQVQTTGIFPASRFSLLMQPASPKGKVYTLPAVNLPQVLAREALASRNGELKYYKFGESVPFRLDIETAGEWKVEADARARVWRARLQSAGAESMSVIFDRFYLPPGAELYVLGRNMTLGAYTGRLNNRESGEFLTMPVSGDAVILEYWEPLREERGAQREVELGIAGVVYGYRKILARPKGYQSAGPCNIDVACPLGNRARDQINAVGMLLTDVGRSCSGTMLNNPRQDGRQLFLTANHCLQGVRDTERFLVFFNYQHKECVSDGAPLNAEPHYDSVHGMRILARWAESDFALMEILETIPDEYHVYYAGWTRHYAVPHNVTGIHHPAGDVKKISAYMGRTYVASELLNPAGLFLLESDKYHWWIPAWTYGVTEGGSSGSALFDVHGRVVGHLHRGIARCEHPQGWDLYGALCYHWKSAPSAEGWLAPHLDPDGRQVMGMGGNYFFQGKETGSTKTGLQHTFIEYELALSA